MGDVQRLLVDLTKRTSLTSRLVGSHQVIFDGFSLIKLILHRGCLLASSSRPRLAAFESTTSALRTQPSSQVIPGRGHEELGVGEAKRLGNWAFRSLVCIVLLNQLAHSELIRFLLHILHVNIHDAVDIHLGRDGFVCIRIWSACLRNLLLCSCSIEWSVVFCLGPGIWLLH